MPAIMNKNNISQVKSSQIKSNQVKSRQIKSSQIKSYVHILETENGNKDDDHLTIVVVRIMINIVYDIDEKVKEI